MTSLKLLAAKSGLAKFTSRRSATARPSACGLLPRQFLRDRAVFIHVPKSAGSALLDAWLGFQTGHVTVEEYQADDPHFFSAAFIFTFVRNPLSRFISAYDHIQTDDLWSYLPEVKRQLDHEAGSVSELAEKLTPTSEILKLPWFAPQHSFLEINGRLAVNRIFKTESFDSDLEVLCAETGIRLRVKLPVNRRGDPLAVPSDRLNEAAIANLCKLYARDFILFGYF